MYQKPFLAFPIRLKVIKQRHAPGIPIPVEIRLDEIGIVIGMRVAVLDSYDFLFLLKRASLL
jgi:hypothetical protein